MYLKFIGKKVVIRSSNMGVFYGELASISADSQTVVLNHTRRIWYWDGAASISQIATEGVSKPENCKFSVVTDTHLVNNVGEIILLTETALSNLNSVPSWKK